MYLNILSQIKLIYHLNKGKSKTAKYGCIYVQSRHDKALVPNGYKSCKVKENVNACYIQYLFATKLLDRQLKGTISSTALWIVY